MSGDGYSGTERLDYAAFARRARDERLSKYEKIGFPDSYRAGFEAAIFADICEKLPRLAERGLQVLDIGPGCSELPQMLIERCRVQGHDLHLVDSPEMLSLLPDAPYVDKRPGLFPRCRAELADLLGRTDVILAYSLLHHVVLDANPFDFLDLCIQLMAPGGVLLIGDIPNVSKRSRFFSSEAGVAYHRAFTGQDSLPAVSFNAPVPGQIDDAILLGLVARAVGADAYLLPQPASLPMHNRREDILVRKP